MPKRVVLKIFFLLASVLLHSVCGSSTDQSQQQETRSQPGPAHNDKPEATLTSYDFSSLDQTLERTARKHGGCALVLVKDGRVIYRKGFGAYGPETVIPIASASKWLSGAVIMNLVDEEKLSLDDPVSKYLPEFTDAKSSITIRQLFGHTSGLPPEAGCRNDKRTTLERCVWREMFDEASGQPQEASSQGALGFSPWIDFERKLGGALSVRGSFSQALPDYLAVKEQVRRIVAKE